MWRQSQHQRHSSYSRCGNFNHLPTTTTWRDYSQLRHTMTRLSSTTNYYYSDSKELLASTTTSQLHINYYYAETSLLLRLTTCSVHKLLLCGVTPVHFVRLQTMRFHQQFTYNHLLLQLYRTIIWHCVLILLFPFRDDVDLWCSVISTPVMMMSIKF